MPAPRRRRSSRRAVSDSSSRCPVADGLRSFRNDERRPLCDRVQHLGEDMNMKLKTKNPLLLLMTVGFAAAAGCRLSPPKSVDQGEGGVCIDDPVLVTADGGVAADDSDGGAVPID